MEVKSRDEIEEKYHWTWPVFMPLTRPFAGPGGGQGVPAQCAAYQGKISQSAQELLAFLRLDDQVTIELSRLLNYAQRKSDEDHPGFQIPGLCQPGHEPLGQRLQRLRLVYPGAAVPG